ERSRTAGETGNRRGCEVGSRRHTGAGGPDGESQVLPYCARGAEKFDVGLREQAGDGGSECLPHPARGSEEETAIRNVRVELIGTRLRQDDIIRAGRKIDVRQNSVLEVSLRGVRETPRCRRR